MLAGRDGIPEVCRGPGHSRCLVKGSCFNHAGNRRWNHQDPCSLSYPHVGDSGETGDLILRNQMQGIQGLRDESCHTCQWPAHANLYILTLIGFEAAPSGTPTSMPKGTRFSFDPVKGSLISPANIHRNQRPETVTLEGGQVASEDSWLRFSLSVRPCVPGVANGAALCARWC